MKFLPVVFLLVLAFASCEDDKPHDQNNGDSTLFAVEDTSSYITDTILTADGKKVVVTHDCSVLKRRIPADSALDQLGADMEDLSMCVDSFDFRYVVPNLLASWLSEERVKGNSAITYGDFVKHLNEFKRTEAYAQLHMQVMTLDSVRSLPFNANRIDVMRPTFGKLGMTEPEWNAFAGFSRTYPVPETAKNTFTWGDMMDAFESFYSQYNESQ
jgi:hypothetical protein